VQGHASNSSKPPAVDSFFLQLTVALLLLGLAFIFSASSYESVRYTGHAWSFITKHMFVVFFAIPLTVLISSLHYRWWKNFAWVLSGVAVILLLLTATEQFGVLTGGSRRWISLGFFQLQVSEFVKVFSVLLMAKALHERDKRWLSGLLVLMSAALVLKQPDLGTSMLILSTLVFTAFAYGFNILVFIGGVAAAGYLGWQHVLSTPYQMERIKYWLDPYSDPLGHGYNLIQSQNAIGSGGVLGTGFGESLQKLGALPIPHADFIFSIICEEIGLLGALVVLLLFFAWIARALYISVGSEDEFARILGVGLTLVIALQVLINIGVATGLFPITGMTLPFVSYGGSSLLSLAIATGILLNISRFVGKN